MRSLVMVLAVVNLTACAKKESGPSAGSGSAIEPAPVEPAGSAGSAGSGSSAPTGSGSATTSPSDEVAQLVVASVGSKALGSQTIEPGCVSVSILPAGDWTVAAARLKDCGDKIARSILWVFKRSGNGKWSEDYAGQPPKCWKGIPADIAEAVSIASKIPGC